MNRTIAIALFLVLIITGAAGTVWYVLDDTDNTTAVAQAAGESQGVVKKVETQSIQAPVNASPISETPEASASSPTVSASSDTGPAASDPAASDPAASDPAASDPAASDPVVNSAEESISEEPSADEGQLEKITQNETSGDKKEQIKTEVMATVETQVPEKAQDIVSESTVATPVKTTPGTSAKISVQTATNTEPKTTNSNTIAKTVINSDNNSGNITDSVENVDQTEPSLAFDVIRVEKTGDTVLAGRAPAGSDVRILDGTTILGSIEADKNGQWVYILETPLEPGAHELGLLVKGADGIKLRSRDVAIVNVPKGEESVLAVLVPDDTSGVSKVLQIPEKVGEDGIRDGDLALDSVDYDDEGQTVIGGTSQPGQKVVGYLNNEFFGQGVTDASGRWVVEPEEKVEEGLHQLRIDQVDDTGKVIARVEIPFSRSGKVESLPDERVVTVQPGNSLWRISRAIYGQGARYAVIYNRNQGQIRNPDLIYPGQIFVLPKEN